MTTALRRDHPVPSRPQLWRISERTAFAALREAGHRVRRGPLTVTWVPPVSAAPAAHPRVAFAVGRSVGNAVVRNRVRRRVRAALRDLQVGGRLPAGDYLIGGSAELARVPWTELRSTLDGAVASATGGMR